MSISQNPISPSARTNVLGVGVSALDLPTAILQSEQLIQSGGKGYICVTGVHGVMEAQTDPDLRNILNQSFLTVPDGMPTVWVGRLQGCSNMRRVYGPDFMLDLCRVSAEKGYRHFLYGGQDGVAEELRDNLVQRFPGLKIVGTFTPPFRNLNASEREQLRMQVDELKPDIIWVGLSTPKQEKFMANALPYLNTRLMVGVGAAFDIHTSRIDDAPNWMKQTGLQWFHRLLQEPSRLWRRYLINNPKFAMRITGQFLSQMLWRPTTAAF